jgi:hypothetical protein
MSSNINDLNDDEQYLYDQFISVTRNQFSDTPASYTSKVINFLEDKKLLRLEIDTINGNFNVTNYKNPDRVLASGKYSKKDLRTFNRIIRMFVSREQDGIGDDEYDEIIDKYVNDDKEEFVFPLELGGGGGMRYKRFKKRRQNSKIQE